MSNETSIRIRIASYNIGDYSTANGSSGDGISKGNGTTGETPYDAIYSKIH